MTAWNRDTAVALESPFLEHEVLLEFEGGKGADQASVTVVLDEPVDSDDAFRLLSADGKYSRLLRARDAKPLLAGEKVLRFEGVSPSKSYRLIHYRADKLARPVYLDLPFKALSEAGHPPKTARNTYVTLPSQLPRRLPDRYGAARPVDADLVARSPVLVNLAVEDPKL
jgi:hypothetical protein